MSFPFPHRFFFKSLLGKPPFWADMCQHLVHTDWLKEIGIWTLCLKKCFLNNYNLLAGFSPLSSRVRRIRNHPSKIRCKFFNSLHSVIFLQLGKER